MKLKKFIKLFLFLSIFFVLSFSAVMASSSVLRIKDISLNQRTVTTEATIEEFNYNSVETNIIFHKKGDYVIYRVVVQNNDNRDYIITSVSDDNTNNYIDYEYINYSNKRLNANSTAEFFVKVKYYSKLDDLTKKNISNSKQKEITV